MWTYYRFTDGFTYGIRGKLNKRDEKKMVKLHGTILEKKEF